MNLTEEEIVQAIADGSSSPFVRAVLPKLVEQWRLYRALVERVAQAQEAVEFQYSIPGFDRIARFAVAHTERQDAIDACREAVQEKT